MTQYGPRFTAKASWVQTTYLDKGEHCPGRGFESAVCPPEGTRIESLACHVSPRGMSCGVAMWASGGGPYNALLLTWLFCSGRIGGLKMMLLKLWLLFEFNVQHGATEEKKKERTFMARRHSWGNSQAVCRFNSGTVGRLEYRGAASLK